MIAIFQVILLTWNRSKPCEPRGEYSLKKMFFIFQSYRKTPERIKIASEEFCGLQYIE
jgi:hypothetical protein